MDISALVTALKAGGPLSMGVFLVVSAAKKYVPKKFRALAASGLGLLVVVGYQAVTTDASLQDVVLAALAGGYAGVGASGIHESITKHNEG